jgi:iron(III) transport system permease protein
MKLVTNKKVGDYSYLFFSLIALLPVIFLFIEGKDLPEKDIETWSFVLNDVVPGLLKNSFQLVICSILGCALIAVPMALILELTDIPAKRLWNLTTILPLAFPLYVLAFIYVGLFEWAGPVLTFLREAGFDSLGNLKFKNVFGVAFVFTMGLFPYILMPIRLVLRKVDYKLFQASKSLGKSEGYFIKKVLAPLIVVPLFAGCTIVGMEVMADFGAVSVFNFDTFTTSIYTAWSSLFSLSSATRLSLMLLSFSLVLFFLESHVSKKQVPLVTSKSNQSLFKLNIVWKTIALVFMGTVTFFSLILPLIQLGVWSLEAWSGEVNGNYLTLIKNTLLLALKVGVSILIISLILVYAERKKLKEKWLPLFRSFFLVGYALPGNIVAVGIFLLFKNVLGTSPMGMGLGLVVIGLTYRFLSVGHRTISPTARLINPSLEKASKSLGKSNFTFIRKIWLPFLKGNAVYAFLFVFVEVAKEMPLTLMLRPMGHDTLSTKIYELTSEGEWERASLGALFLVILGMFTVIMMSLKGDNHAKDC